MIKRWLLGLLFILVAHVVLWPLGFLGVGLLCDLIGVTIIYNPLKRHLK